MTRVWVCFLCLAAAWAQSAGSQKSPKIEGRVVNAKNGEPVPRATLTLAGSGRNAAPRGGRSDGEGRFLIENIEPGSYRLTAERVGFLRQGYGSSTPGGAGAPLNLSEGQHLKDLEIRLTPQGVIMGLVVDEDGDPLPRVNVTAWRQGNSASPQTTSGSMTNDIGEYRIAGLSPGRYIVVAERQAGGMARGGPGRGGLIAAEQAPVPTYYPSTADASAALPIDVAAGQEIAGINIAMRTGSLFRIQGRVMGANPQDTAGGMRLMLMPRGNSVFRGITRGGAQVRADGSFEITRVPAGSYYIIAQNTGRQGGGGPVGKTMVDVSTSDITGLLVSLTEPLTVSGIVKVEGQQAAEPQRVNLSLTPFEAGMFGYPSGRTASDGSFKVSGVFPDRYYLNLSGLPEGAYVKSVKLAGQEVLDKGVDLSGFRGSAALEVLLSLKGATLEGTATAGDKPAVGSTIAVLPDPPRPSQPYLNKTATADQDGKFTIRGLAPGRYKVYAFEESMPELARDPSLAAPFEQKAVKVDLDAGAVERVELKALKPEDAGR
ncbi:MAG: carboxypeptidase regulatory-like domain-containing protein [Bryobacteraceae bacterium]